MKSFQSAKASTIKLDEKLFKDDFEYLGSFLTKVLKYIENNE